MYSAHPTAFHPGSSAPLPQRLPRSYTSPDSVSTSSARSPTADPSGSEPPKTKATRGSRACTVCRRLKMKCVGAEHGPPCKRCQTGGHECIFEESNRGKRSSKKHEILTRSLRKMERTLDTGYHHHDHYAQPPSPKLHSLPDNSLNPLGLLAEASLANRRAQQNVPSMSASGQVGVASANYFKPGPISILPLRRLYIERQIQPEMLSFVRTEEVVALFQIFFERMNMCAHVLDPEFHTPSLVCSRSPFLLTTICAVASKFYDPNPELHPRLSELANKLAFSVPAKGYKSVEIVQAYLLLSLWGSGAVERYEQDKTWLLLGMAIRMATDLNLHRKTAVNSEDTQEGRARDYEVHNRERTWIMCFCLDRSFSASWGSRTQSRRSANIVRNVTSWCRSSIANVGDGALAGYAELQRLMSRSLDFLYSATDSRSGLQVDLDYMLVIKTFEAQLTAWKEQWIMVPPGPSSRWLQYTKSIANFYFNYSVLVLNSFGLQNALERTAVDVGHFFGRCHSAATTCALIVRDELAANDFLRHSPDSHCVLISYAVLTLLKLLRPEFQAFLEMEQRTLQLVKDVADVLNNAAAHPLHTPALYAGFLHALISAKLDPQSSTTGMDTSSASQTDHLNNGPTLSHNGTHVNGSEPFLLNEFQFDGEMGPVAADISTFPPTMGPGPADETAETNGLNLDSILNGFWIVFSCQVCYNSSDVMSGGFVFGPGGSGLITPRLGLTPAHSGHNTPSRGGNMHGTPGHHDLSSKIHAAFDGSAQQSA
ncbi:fungal-specific transcription factor domain-containing protein [Schizophyllum amplum]|uniref:Fungal-specific transcription factor domain-containing protein n=1 Tax=Schizophyllum amplum TaxID=97359 RepID=A0A550C314_9AGAR|nr:fungal-specific transcription factor domain-containing protein [Auriculariopsis ampla]